MGEVVGGELAFEAVGRFAVWRGHYPGVVHQHVQSLALAEECLGCGPDAGEGGIVHLDELDAVGFEEGVACCFAFFEVADCEEDFSAGGGEGSCGFDANAGAGAGDEEDFVGHFAGETFVLDDLEGGGARVTRAREIIALVGFGEAVGHGCRMSAMVCLGVLRWLWWGGRRVLYI